MRHPTEAGLTGGLQTELVVECSLDGELGTLHFFDGDNAVAESFQFRLQPDKSIKWVGGQVLADGHGLYRTFLELTQPGGYLRKLGWGPSVIQGNAPEADFYMTTCFDVTERDDQGQPTLLSQNAQRTADWLEAHS